jgi:F-type H+-transporting ATPase subunit gamma
MTKRSVLKKHISSLSEIKSIVNAMKNLSLMETNKVNKLISTQSRVVDTIQKVILDFLSYHQAIAKSLSSEEPKLCILIGSERGFCGNFNELLLKHWHEKRANVKTIAVGNKLVAKMQKDSPDIIKINGANIAQEIVPVVLSLIKELGQIYVKSQFLIDIRNWEIIFNTDTDQGIAPKTFRPFTDLIGQATPAFPVAPLLYLDPEDFFLKLTEQYLYAILYQNFYYSFIAENNQRLKHMDAALNWMDKKNNELKLKLNEFRQEEITEEIEVMSLSAHEILLTE